MMNDDKMNAVYDILVKIGGAIEDDRDSFTQEMMSNNPTDEWRFQGKLGFGGKYWRKTNQVSCYPEDETPEKMGLIHEINSHLSILS